MNLNWKNIYKELFDIGFSNVVFKTPPKWWNRTVQYFEDDITNLEQLEKIDIIPEMNEKLKFYYKNIINTNLIEFDEKISKLINHIITLKNNGLNFDIKIYFNELEDIELYFMGSYWWNVPINNISGSISWRSIELSNMIFDYFLFESPIDTILLPGFKEKFKNLIDIIRKNNIDIIRDNRVYSKDISNIEYKLCEYSFDDVQQAYNIQLVKPKINSILPNEILDKIFKMSSTTYKPDISYHHFIANRDKLYNTYKDLETPLYDHNISECKKWKTSEFAKFECIQPMDEEL